ncbi:unnamed protein product [Ectocarpus sp. 12 AP-2014]
MGERGRQKVQMQSPEMVSKHVLEWYRRTRASTKGQKVATNLAAVAAERFSVLVAVLMGVGICLLILLVVALWFAVEAVQVFGGSVVRYCHNARNVLGNSSFFNKVSNSYKALTNIPVEREATR